MDEITQRECILEVAEIPDELEEVKAKIEIRGKTLSDEFIQLQNKVEKLFLRIEKVEQKLAA
jgi:chaperonin cofactor prefoldin